MLFRLLSRDSLKKLLENTIIPSCPRHQVTTYKQKFPGVYDMIFKYTSFLSSDSPLTQRLWHIVHNKWETQRCSTCNDGLLHFEGFAKNYRAHCSTRCSTKDAAVQKKHGDTCEKLFGARNVWSRGSIVRKHVEDRRKELTGFSNPWNDPDIIEKRARSYEKNYGKGIRNPSQNPIIKAIKRQQHERRLIRQLTKLLKSLDLESLSSTASWENYTTVLHLRCLKCKTEFDSTYRDLYYRLDNCPSCPTNRPIGTSAAEQEVYDFIRESLSDSHVVHRNYRKLLPSFREVDIYIPSKHLAIEYDGLYYHSTAFQKNQVSSFNFKSHLDKTNACEKKGIQLIHIFEDEWLFKQEIVKSRLRHILGVANTQKIHARKCQIQEISSKTKNDFLTSYHLQGKDSSAIKLGAFYLGELVSVMTFAKPSLAKGQKSGQVGVWELSRFCSHFDYHIPGIAGKLFAYFKRNYTWEKVYSYADRRWSVGNLYFQLGFDSDTETGPNYWYVKGCRRFHRFGLRKRSDEPKDITEEILRKIDGYSRIYDCGSLKFILTSNK